MAIGKQPDLDDVGEEGGGESIFAEINITPLTDVFLVMVVIFMVSALAVQAERNNEKKQEEKQKQQDDKDKSTGLKIILPQGKQQEIDTSSKSLMIEIPVEGDIYIGGKPVKDDQLDGFFRLAYTKDKMTQVVIRADKAASHGRVVNLMERAKQVGLSRLAIATGSK